VTDGKKLLLFFDFLSVKNMIGGTKIKIFGVKPILSIYSIYDESKKVKKLTKFVLVKARKMNLFMNHTRFLKFLKFALEFS
jgi:hypothetical protein